MHGVVCILFLSVQNSLAITQTLTTSDENNWVNGAKITNLSPSTILIHNTSWHITVNQDNDQWGLWLKTNQTWGFHSSLPSSFSIQLSGSTNSVPSDLLISLSDGTDTKYTTILIRLNGQNDHWIAPGCVSHHNPTQPLISGDVYLTMADQPTPGTRICRAAYIDALDTCSYTTFGPSAHVVWPMTFTIHNYPITGYSTITFESQGYSPISCGFDEAFLPNIGTNIWITSLVQDNFDISSIRLEYTSDPSVSPTTSEPTIHPTQLPSISPTQNPTIPHIANPTYNSIKTPTTTLMPTYNPSLTSTTNTAITSTHNPSTEPTTEPTVRPTFQLLITDSPTTSLTKYRIVSTIITTNIASLPTIAFLEKNFSLIVLITISVGISIIAILFTATVCVFVWKSCCRDRRYKHEIVYDEPSSEFPSKCVDFERQNEIEQQMELQQCLSTTPSEHSILTLTTGEKTTPVEKVRRFDFEGDKTIPEMDEIDRLYGASGHKHTKTIYTDIESMYASPTKMFNDTFIRGVPQEGAPQILEEKDESKLYEVPSTDGYTECPVISSSRVLHDTHGTSIELTSHDNKVYGDNESKEEYYIDDCQDTDNDIDDDIILTPQLKAIIDQAQNYS